MSEPSLQDVAAVLENSKVYPGGVLRAACPAHGGEDRNLSFRYEGDTPLATCHSHNCPFEEIMGAIRKRLSPVKVTHNGHRQKDETVKERTTWQIRDEVGKLVAVHVRDDLADGSKKVWWKTPSGKSGLEGRSSSEMPLYGAEDAARAPAGSWVVVVEGEKACDALKASRKLRESGVIAAGTVTGSASVPDADALAILKGQRVVLWADNDEGGRQHMGRIAEALRGVASEVRWFEWEGAPEKGDAADHPDVDGLGPALKLAPRWSRPPPIPGRALVGQAIERGVEPPEELLPDLLLANKAHNIFAAGGVGKTWVLVWIATELVARGKTVVVFDLENGLRTYAERFEEMGADPKALDERLHYYPFPAFDRESYARMLDEDRPDIVMFDSWIGFLSANGLEESENQDIATWADGYSKPALRRGSAVAVLDHVPHDHERERGASRKRDEMDVVWRLTKIGDFDREQTAALSMTRMKDREGWLPERLTFEIGGDPAEGFVMRRDDSLSQKVEVTHLTSKERQALQALREFPDGATTAEWLAKLPEIKKQALHHIRRLLVKKGKVEDLGGRYKASEGVLIGGIEGIDEVEGVLNPTLNTQGNQGAAGGIEGVDPPKGGSNTPFNTPTTPKSPAVDVNGVENDFNTSWKDY